MRGKENEWKSGTKKKIIFERENKQQQIKKLACLHQSKSIHIVIIVDLIHWYASFDVPSSILSGVETMLLFI